jgi:cytochrome c oxidase subunit I+III
VEIGGGIRLPTYMAGPVSHGWWAMAVLLLVAGALYLSFLFSYLYLWTVSPQVWPSARALPDIAWPMIAGGLLLFSGGALILASRFLGGSPVALAGLVMAGAIALTVALGLDIWSQWQSGCRPDANSYGALVYLASMLQFEIVAPVCVMAGFMLARLLKGQLDATRRSVYDNLSLFWLYAVGQGLLGLLLTHGFPRVAG